MTEWTKPYCGYSYYGKFKDRRYGSICVWGTFVETWLWELGKSKYSDGIVHHCVEEKTFHGDDRLNKAKQFVEQFVKGE